MNFLLLGVDSLIAGIAICAVVDRRARLPLAALFGVADGVMFLIGAGLGWQIPGVVAQELSTAILVIIGLNLLLIAAGSQRVGASWSIWVVPWALTLDNLAYGLVGERTAVLSQAGEQAVSSALLALVGLLAAVVLPRVVPAMGRRVDAYRVAGGALIVAAGGLVLLG